MSELSEMIRTPTRFCPRCAHPFDYRQIEDRERPVCPSCGFVFYLDPKVAACTIPLHEGRVVLLRRGIRPRQGYWVFPGGYVNRGEVVAEAAVRETREEVSLEVRLTGLVGVYSAADDPVVVIVYRAESLGGIPSPGPEALEVRSFLPEEIPWEELAFPSTGAALRDFLAR